MVSKAAIRRPFNFPKGKNEGIKDIVWQDCRRKTIHDIRDNDMGKVINPVKGRALYEGKAKNGLVIRFWYNFDLNLIEDAYPVIKKNDKK